MGVEHPYLALVSFMLFASMVISITLSHIWLLQQMNRLPTVESFATTSYRGDTLLIRVTVRLVRGTPISFSHIVIDTDAGSVKLSPTESAATVGNSTLRLRLERFRGVLYPGQEGSLVVEVAEPLQVFGNREEYRAAVFFNTTIAVVTFSVEHNSY